MKEILNNKIDFSDDENYINFDKLNPGDNFIYDNEYYMKCHSISFEDETYNAVNLKDGYILRIHSHIKVIPVKLKVVKDYN